MASSTLPASPFRPSPPGLQAPDTAKLKHLSVRTPVRRLPVAASAAPSGAAAAARERRRFLERYGLNPDDFEEDAEEDPREERKDRRRRRQSGRGTIVLVQTVEAAVTPAKAAEPRETHKMLQVLGGKVRRRKLLSPKDRNVRPMMEVVRGASFDILQGNNAFKRRQWIKAIEFYSEAISLSDTNATYYCNRAAAYLELGRFKQAEADCDRALLLDRKNVKAYLRRGCAREVTLNHKEALQDFRQALALEPQNKTALAAERRLQKLLK